VLSVPPSTNPWGQITSQQTVLSSSQGRYPGSQSAFSGGGGSSGGFGQAVKSRAAVKSRNERKRLFMIQKEKGVRKTGRSVIGICVVSFQAEISEVHFRFPPNIPL